MARSPKASDEQLLDAVMTVFREAGYEGASLTRLSEATGLKRASLYHRFPGGKAQMAEEALEATKAWAEDHVLRALHDDSLPVGKRIEAAGEAFRALYNNGRTACLINLFSAGSGLPESLAVGVQSVLATLISALSEILEEAGLTSKEARIRAVRALILVQGAVVMARGFQDTAPFEATMSRWTEDLLTGA